VTHLGVAHLTVGQTDIESARRDERMGILRLQRIVAGLLRQIDGVECVLLGMGVLPQPSRMMSKNRFAR